MKKKEKENLDIKEEFNQEIIEEQNEAENFAKTKDKSKTKKKKIIGVVSAFVIVLAVGVVGNWYYENSDVSQTLQPLLDSATERTLGKAELVNGTTETTEENNYFSSARLDRQNARDESIENLQTIINNTEETEDTKKDAIEKLSSISSYINMENKIETLVCAKGVSNCLAVISDDGQKVDIIIDSETLDDNLIMQIKDIAISQVGCSFENVSIIQSK